MGTLTSRLKLLKPDRLELVKVLDHLNANLDRLDSGGNGAYVCTSTTRPNGNNYPLFEGQLIYETDTGYLMMRAGGTWLNVVGGSWQVYNPMDNSNITLGNGTAVGAYTMIGRTVHLRAALTVGSTTAWSASGSTLGVPIASSADKRVSMTGAGFKSGTGNAGIFVRPATNTSFFLYNKDGVALTPNSSFATEMTVGSVIQVGLSYEAF